LALCLLDIVFALELSKNKVWLQHGDILIESDLKNALSWMRNLNICPWELRFHCNKLSNILVELPKVSFVHVNQEANAIADVLAKEGSSMEGSWVKLSVVIHMEHVGMEFELVTLVDCYVCLVLGVVFVLYMVFFAI